MYGRPGFPEVYVHINAIFQINMHISTYVHAVTLGMESWASGMPGKPITEPQL